MKVRTHLVLLVLTALLPVLVFAGTMVGLFAAEQRRQTEQGLQETTRALATAVDRELSSAIATLEALAVDLEAGALDAFHARALRVAAQHPGWTAIGVFDTTGRLVFSTMPLALTPPSIADRPYFQAVIATGRPAVSGYVPSRLTGDPVFAVVVPVSTRGRLGSVVFAAVTPGGLSALLADQRLSPNWLGAVVDADGIILARTRAAERFVGRPATPGYLTRTRHRQEDVFRVETLEGLATYTSFSRVRTSGWTVALAVPAVLVDGAIRRSVVTVVAGGALLLAFGLVVACLFGRRIARPLGALASAAPALARGEPLKAASGTVTEVNELSRALEAASAERRAGERALRASEHRLRRIVEGHVMGVAFTDGARVRDANDAFLALTGYQRADLAAGRVSWHGMTPAEHAEADARAAEELRRDGWCRPYENELLRRDGRRITVMVSATLIVPESGDAIVFVHDLTELRWAQQERERLFALLHALLESAPIGYAVLDRDLRFVAVNEVLAAVHGVPAARHIGRTVREVVPELADALEPHHRQVLESGAPVLNIEVGNDNSAWRRGRHYLRSCYPIRDHAGDLLGVGLALLDITGRKRADQRLTAQHAVTRILAEAESLEDAAPRLIESLCDALDCGAGEIWRIDRDGGVAHCIEALATSACAEGFAGAARGLVIERGAGLQGRAWAGGKSVWVRELTPGVDVARADDAAQAGLRSVVAFPLMHSEVLGVASFYCRRVWEPDADVLDMLASVGSQVGQFMERRRAERERADLLALTAQVLSEVEESERRYRQLVEALPHVAWTATPDGTVDYLNRHWFDYTGLTRPESIGDRWTRAVHPDDLEGTLERWRRALALGEGLELEHRLRRRDGFYRWFLGRVAPIRNEVGAVVTWLGVAVDIDAQKRAELGALDASRAKDTFLATLSHELRKIGRAS